MFSQCICNPYLQLNGTTWSSRLHSTDTVGRIKAEDVAKEADVELKVTVKETNSDYGKSGKKLSVFLKQGNKTLRKHAYSNI